MWIFCCGMIRSGSTLQYQIACELVKTRQTGKALGWVENEDALDQLREKHGDNKDYVVKLHDYFPGIKSLSNQDLRFIYSYRDPRDVILSLMAKQKKSFNQVFNKWLIDKLLYNFENWTGLEGIYISRYESIIEDLSKEINGIAEYLGYKISQEERDRLLKEFSLSNLKEKISKSSLDKSDYIEFGDLMLDTDHIRSGSKEQWKKELSGLQIAFIEYFFRDWLIANNYKPSKTKGMSKLAYYYFRLFKK